MNPFFKSQKKRIFNEDPQEHNDQQIPDPHNILGSRAQSPRRKIFNDRDQFSKFNRTHSQTPSARSFQNQQSINERPFNIPQKQIIPDSHHSFIDRDQLSKFNRTHSQTPSARSFQNQQSINERPFNIPQKQFIPDSHHYFFPYCPHFFPQSPNFHQPMQMVPIASMPPTPVRRQSFQISQQPHPVQQVIVQQVPQIQQQLQPVQIIPQHTVVPQISMVSTPMAQSHISFVPNFEGKPPMFGQTMPKSPMNLVNQYASLSQTRTFTSKGVKEEGYETDLDNKIQQLDERLKQTIQRSQAITKQFANKFQDNSQKPQEIHFKPQYNLQNTEIFLQKTNIPHVPYTESAQKPKIADPMPQLGAANIIDQIKNQNEWFERKYAHLIQKQHNHHVEPQILQEPFHYQEPAVHQVHQQDQQDDIEIYQGGHFNLTELPQETNDQDNKDILEENNFIEPQQIKEQIEENIV